MPFTSRCAAATPLTGSLNATVICVRLVMVPGTGLTLRTVGGLVSETMDSSEHSKSKSLLPTALWKTWTARTFVPNTR